MKAPQLIVGAAALLLALPSWPAAARQDSVSDQARQILDFCLENPNKCSLSVRHVSGGWERHINPDRLNPLASSWKVVPLIAYARAVASGELDPGTLVPRDDWARFFVGGDGGALADAWERFGSPDAVTLDQMVSAMIQESDNVTPDWLNQRLGRAALQQTIDRFLTRRRGYHDVPRFISSMFVTWDENPFEPLIGDRIAASYSDYAAFGYGRELDAWGNALEHPEAVNIVDMVRQYRCVFLPWVPPLPCTPPTLETSESNLVALQQGFYARSSTRTYTDLMAGILQRNLLPGAVQQIVEAQIEAGHEVPPERFARYGAKTGTLGTVGGLTVVNITSYAQTQPMAIGAGGVAAAVTLHLRGNGDYIPTTFAFTRGSFVQALVEDGAFAQEVFDRIPAERPRPDLIARVANIRNAPVGGEQRLTVDYDIFNAGAARSASPSFVATFLSLDNQLDLSDVPIGLALVRPLPSGGQDRRRVSINLGPYSVDGLYLITVLDPWNMVHESEEAGNIVWEKLYLQ